MHDDVRRGTMLKIMMLSMSILAILPTAIQAQTAHMTMCPCYTLRISPAEQTVRIGEPIIIHVVVTNTVDHEIYMEKNSRRPGDLYFVDVKDTHGIRQKKTDDYSRVTNLRHSKVSGEIARPTAYRDKDGIEHIDTYRGSGEPLRTVKPGDNVEDSIPVNDLYILDKAGTYTLQLKRIEGKTEIDSNTITITVTN
jgi:hypothetical protein